MKQRHPGRVVGMIEGRFYPGKTFVQEVKRLRKAEQYDHVYDTEGEHITSYHAVYHRHEWPR